MGFYYRRDTVREILFETENKSGQYVYIFRTMTGQLLRVIVAMNNNHKSLYAKFRSQFSLERHFVADTTYLRVEHIYQYHH